MDEDSGSWLGHAGPPNNFSKVAVESPAVFSQNETLYTDTVLQHCSGAVDDAHVVELWFKVLH
jgi:hypothetical protein